MDVDSKKYSCVAEQLDTACPTTPRPAPIPGGWVDAERACRSTRRAGVRNPIVETHMPPKAAANELRGYVDA